MAELKYWLWLTSRKGMDSVRALKLLERFVTPEQVYYADQGDIAELGLSPNLERSLADKSMDAPEVILGECDRLAGRSGVFVGWGDTHNSVSGHSAVCGKGGADPGSVPGAVRVKAALLPARINRVIMRLRKKRQYRRLRPGLRCL